MLDTPSNLARSTGRSAGSEALSATTQSVMNTVSINERLFVSDLRHAPSQRYNTAYCIRWLEQLKAPPNHLVENYGTASEHPWLAQPGVRRPRPPQTALSSGLSPRFARGFTGGAVSRYRTLRTPKSASQMWASARTDVSGNLPELVRKPMIRASNAVEMSRLNSRVLHGIEPRPKTSVEYAPKNFSHEKSPRLTLKAQRLFRMYGNA
ncbi:hypothetical protein RI054_13g66140 [Pseudoscourfieldia marina]